MRLKGVPGWVALLGLTVLFVGPGCPKAATVSPLTLQNPNVDMPAEELRARIYQFTDRFSGVVQDAADKIRSGTDDPEISRRALQWKTSAIPACQRAAFQPDPLAAGFDVWVLTAQMNEFFDDGHGSALFGSLQPVASEASALLLREMIEMVRGIALTDDISRGSEFVEEWVETHPLENLLFVRVSTRPVLQGLVAKNKKSAFASVGSMAAEVSDLNDRLAIYAETLPAQARWQAELFYDHVATAQELDTLMTEVASISSAADRVSELVETLNEPPIDDRIEQIHGTLRTESDHVLGEVDRQRRETLSVLQAEREIILERVDHERDVTIAALRQERIEIVAAVEAFTLQIVDASTVRAEQMANRLFWRLAVLGASLVVFLVLAGLLAIRMIKA